MRIKAILIAICLAATAPVQAQEMRNEQGAGLASGIVDSAIRAASGMGWQPMTQPGGGALIWTGVVMVVGGGVLAGLSDNALAIKDVSAAGFYPGDCDYVPELDCTKMNQGTLWLGIGLAGAGAAMAIVGKARQSRSITFVPTPGGAAVFRRFSF